MAWKRPDIGALQAGSGWKRPDIGAIQAEAAAPGTTPKGPLHHPLWGPLAGPVFCVFIMMFNLIKRLI